MNVTNFFYCIAAYNIRAYQVSDVHNACSDSAYVVTRIITCIGAAVLCAVFMLVMRYPSQQVLIVVCYMGYRTVEAFVDVLHGIAHKHKRLDYAGISMISRGLIILCAFIVLGHFFDLLPAVIAMAVLTGLFCLIYDVPRAKKLAERAPVTSAQVKTLLIRCLPLMLVFMSITFYQSYARYALERIYGTTELGAYTTAVTPAVVLQVVVLFMNAPLTSIFSECIKKADRTRFVRTYIIACVLIAVMIIAAVLVSLIAGRWGLELLFGAEILPYTYLLPSAIVMMGLLAALWYMNVVFTVLRDLNSLLLAALAGAAVCIIATELLLREYGLIGANYAMITCQITVLLILNIRFFTRSKGNWYRVNAD